MRRRVSVGLGAVMYVILVASATLAQGTGGASIAGVVRDASGGVLPGVTVEAASPALIEKVKTTVTDEQGQYRIIELRPGPYTVTFTLPSFSTVKREGLELTSNFTASVNAELTVGAIEETVTVSGQSPLVDTQNLTQQKTITKDLIDAVPTSKSQLGIVALMPSVVTPQNSQDVGGSKGERSVRISVHGGKTADQRMLLDGMRYTHLGVEGTGRGFFVNPLEAEEIVIDVGTMGSAEYSLGGATVNMISKSGGNRFNGSVFLGGTGHQLQSDNLTDALKAQGLTTVNGVRGVWDANGAFGGPIVKSKVWFFTSGRTWGTTTRVANLYHDISTNYLFVPDPSQPIDPTENDRALGGRVTWQATKTDQFKFSYGWQDTRFDQNTGLLETGTVSSEATNSSCYRTGLTQASWTHPASSKLLVEAGGTLALLTFGSGLGSDLFLSDYQQCHQGIPDKVSIVDSGLGFTYHGSGLRSNTLSNETNGRFIVSYISGAHQIKTGLFYEVGVGGFRPYNDRSPADANGMPVSYTFLNGVPTGLTEYATPLLTNTNLNPDLGLFVQDQMRLNRLTINLGLRFDWVRESAPATHESAGILVGARDFPAVNNIPNWKDLNPRMAVAYDPFGDGKTALKAGLNRYVQAATVGVATLFAPAISSVNSTTRSWTDANHNFLPDCNLSNPAANAECGPMANANFGSFVSTTTPDPSWVSGWGKRPSDWQMSLSVDREVMPGVALSAGYYRTWYGNFYLTDNLNVTPADYSPYCITAPVNAGLPASISGQPICGLYDINPAKFGLVNNVVTLASNYGKQTEVYNGADVTVNARLGRGATLSGGWNVGTAIQTGVVNAGNATSRTNNCFVVDSPQQLYHCDIQNPYQQRVKVSGSYPLPGDFQASAVFQSLPGANYGALYTATTAQIAPSLGRNLAGNVKSATIDLLPPFSQFGPRMNQLDLRFTKKFALNKTRIQANFDIYNVMNANTVVSYNNTITNPATWLRPTQVVDGRLAKFSVQLDF
jgi:hypothetical protein